MVFVADQIEGLKKHEVCAYCGAQDAPTKDHVIPQALFDEEQPLPNNMITVPCCERCRQQETDPSFFRNIIVSLAENEKNPIASKLQATKMKRSLERRSSAIVATSLNSLPLGLRQMLDALRPKEVYSPAGIYLGTAPAFKISDPTFDAVMAKIIKGLLFHERAIVFSDQLRLSWHPARKPSDYDGKFLGLFQQAPHHQIGNGVFEYRVVFVDTYVPEAHKAMSFWGLSFYEGVVFFAVIAPSNLIKS